LAAIAQLANRCLLSPAIALGCIGTSLDSLRINAAKPGIARPDFGGKNQ
jgi:hypothetical protein